MAMSGLPPPKPIPLKDRSTLVFVERAKLDVEDGAFVAINADGTRTHIPVGGLAGLMLEPGVRISHAAVALAARRACACIRRANPAARAPTSCCGKRPPRWIQRRACAWCGACIKSASRKKPRRAGLLTNCAASKVLACAKPMPCWRASMA